jgi:hypothetical protein
MSYEHDDQAAEEAARHALNDEQLDRLRDQVEAKRLALGQTGVRGHRIKIGTNWGNAVPSALRNTASISRGDVFDLAATADWEAVFAASFIWGTGRIGYGPHRFREIVQGTGGRLNEILTAAVEAAHYDVIAGYAQFYGGHDAKNRAVANAASWSRIDNFGPAFFTKFLYFTTPGALILDNVLARKVHDLAGVPHLVASRGRSVAWSPYRYAVYLKWMEFTARALSAEPDELELTLFTLAS